MDLSNIDLNPRVQMGGGLQMRMPINLRLKFGLTRLIH